MTYCKMTVIIESLTVLLEYINYKSAFSDMLLLVQSKKENVILIHDKHIF